LIEIETLDEDELAVLLGGDPSNAAAS